MIMTYKIILYYKYSEIKDPASFCAEHKKFCEEHNLKGRIIISHEGINGTLEGLNEDTLKYIDFLSSIPGFENTNFKISEGDGKSFPKLSCKVRDEIVSAHLHNDLDPNKITGKYITAEQLHELIHSGKEFYIVDMRNDYEHLVGNFEGSILAPFENFRDLPKVLPKLENLKDKTIITVCTGGVRCEKASGFLVANGFADVYQLENGIVTYMEKYPNEDFNGQLYVFDGRVTMGFNLDDPNRKIIGKCENCGAPSEVYTNCANLMCHKHFICCDDCAIDGKKFCKVCRADPSITGNKDQK